ACLRGVAPLVGLAVGEYTVLVDTGLVRERIAPDHRLVELHVVAGEPRHEPRSTRQFFGVDAGADALEVVAARLDRHHDLFERRVARTLPQAVDRALDLPCAVRDAGQRLGDRET